MSGKQFKRPTYWKSFNAFERFRVTGVDTLNEGGRCTKTTFTEDLQFVTTITVELYEYENDI